MMNPIIKSGKLLLRKILVLSLTFCVSSWADGSSKDYVEGEVLVKFKAGIQEADAAAVTADNGMSIKREFRWLSRSKNRKYLHLTTGKRTTREILEALRNDPRVEFACPNHIRRVYGVTLPNDPDFSSQWALHNTGQTVSNVTGTAGADIKAPEAWSMQRSYSQSAIVAVVDTGVYYTHQDLQDAMWVNSDEIPGNLIDDDGNGYVDDVHGYDFSGDFSNGPDSFPLDVDLHGTHVAGIVAATANNAMGIAGVCDAKIMALKISTDGQTMDAAGIVEAIEYATMMKDRGLPVTVLNFSFGGGADTYDQMEYDATEAAGNAGIIVCAAAGNESVNNDFLPSYPANYDLSNIIVVAASDSSDSLTWFSNYGRTTVHLAAPGENILSTIPVSWDTYGTVEGDSLSNAVKGFSLGAGTTGLTATAVYCGLGYPADFPAGVSNNIAVIRRGTLFFSEKLQNAMNAGASAAIIINNTTGWIDGTLQLPGEWIPAAQMTKDDGDYLVTLLPKTLTVHLAAGYALEDGTSMSTPYVAGAVAIAATQYPDDTLSQRKNRILGSVDKAQTLIPWLSTGGRLNLLHVMDTNTNNMPDWWETQHFGNLNETANGDTDHDNARNWPEYIAGTDPTNSASTLAITNSTINGANIVLMWPSVEGRIYQVQQSENLAAETFSNLVLNLPATPPVNTCTVNTGSAECLFYRIEVEKQ